MTDRDETKSESHESAEPVDRTGFAFDFVQETPSAKLPYVIQNPEEFSPLKMREASMFQGPRGPPSFFV